MNIGFKVWEDGPGWFWLVVSPHSNRGTIGVAPTEAEASRDARSLVEAISTAPARLRHLSMPSARHRLNYLEFPGGELTEFKTTLPGCRQKFERKEQ